MCLKAPSGDIHFLLFVLMICQGLSVGIVQLLYMLMIANYIGLLILQRIRDLFRVTWIRFLTGVRIIK